MKKIISAILIISALTAVSAAAFTDISGNEHQTAIETLAGLDIIKGYEDGTFAPEKLVSRAEFVTIIMRMLGFSNENETDTPFADVSADYWAAGNIKAVKEMGIIDGLSETEFSPESAVTVTQAVKIAVNILGMGKLAEINGGYPSGYVKVGTENKLYKNISSGDERMNRGDVSELIYNTLFANVYEADAYGGGTLSDKNFLLAEMGIEEIKGVVTAVPGMSVSDTEGMPENQIEISGRRYNAERDFGEFFLNSVKCYYDTENETIKCVVSDKSGKSVKISADDIDRVSKKEISYSEGNGKTKKISLPNELSVIYNGIMLATADVSDEIMKPKCGFVTLFDSNDDGKYEYVSVTSYDIYVVKGKSVDTIYDVYGGKFSFEDNGIKSIRIIKNGMAASVDDIKIGDSVLIAESKNKNSVRAVAERNSISGNVKSTYSSNGRDYVVLSGDFGEKTLIISEKYKKAVSESKADKINPGDAITVTVSDENKIACAETDEENGRYEYGYLLGASADGKDGNIKILTTDNKITNFKVGSEEEIRFGRTSGTSYKKSKEILENIIPEILGELGKWAASTKQIVTFVRNDGGGIKELCLADKNRNAGNLSEDVLPANMLYAYGVLDGKYKVDNKTAVINVVNNGTYDDLMKAGDYMSFLSNNGSVTCSLYDIDNSGHVGAMLIFSNVTRYLAEFDEEKGYAYYVDKLNSPIIYVDSVSTKELDGEIYTVVSGISEGERCELLVDYELSGNSEPASNIKTGTALQYDTNYVDVARAANSNEPETLKVFKTRFNFREESPFGVTWNDSTVKSSNAAICLVHGKLTRADFPMITVDTGAEEMMFSVGNTAAVMRYKASEKKFEICESSELLAGEEVFLRTRYNNLREIVIIDRD